MNRDRGVRHPRAARPSPWLMKFCEAQPRKARPIATVLKPTQVGESSRLRRSGERWLRNSANLPRNFGIRGAFFGRRHESALATVYQKHRSVRTRKWKYTD